MLARRAAGRVSGALGGEGLVRGDELCHREARHGYGREREVADVVRQGGTALHGVTLSDSSRVEADEVEMVADRGGKAVHGAFEELDA